MVLHVRDTECPYRDQLSVSNTDTDPRTLWFCICNSVDIVPLAYYIVRIRIFQVAPADSDHSNPVFHHA